jgi:hypothetical protein
MANVCATSRFHFQLGSLERLGARPLAWGALQLELRKRVSKGDQANRESASPADPAEPTTTTSSELCPAVERDDVSCFRSLTPANRERVSPLPKLPPTTIGAWNASCSRSRGDLTLFSQQRHPPFRQGKSWTQSPPFTVKTWVEDSAWGMLGRQTVGV